MLYITSSNALFNMQTIVAYDALAYDFLNIEPTNMNTIDTNTYRRFYQDNPLN